ncbi:MAG: hypothetical protein AABX13_00650 [Nanoarchaeota archaeon]
MTLYQTLTGLAAAVGMATAAYAETTAKHYLTSPAGINSDVKAVVRMIKRQPSLRRTTRVQCGFMEPLSRVTRWYRKDITIGNDKYVLIYDDHNEKDLQGKSDGIIGGQDGLRIGINLRTKQELIFEDHGLDGFLFPNRFDWIGTPERTYARHSPQVDIRTEDETRYHQIIHQIKQYLEAKKK